MTSRPADLDADAVFAEALHDKKRAGDTIDLVIPHGIGRCSIDRTPLSTFHELVPRASAKGRRIRMLAASPRPRSRAPFPPSRPSRWRIALIICAALANGETHVTCNTTCADIEATVRCLTALGARIETVEDGFQVHPTMKSVEFGLLKALAGGTLDCGESE